MLSFLTILLMCFPSLVISLSIETDKAILLRIKQKLGTQPGMETWNSTTSPCQWSGIECTNGKRITGISLANQYINGKIPNEFGNLTSLEKLDLSTNMFNGKIPSELFLLKSLKVLNLYGNFLDGSIPKTIGKIPSLRSLVLAENNLSGKIPSELFLLKNLTILHLYSNKLTGEIPNMIEALNLVEIHLSVNELNGSIPEAIWKIPSLKLLNLANNQFSGHLPLHIRLHTLEFLDISLNKISGPIPSGIINSKNLLEFHASYNFLSGTIPADLGSLPRLQILELSNNNLWGNFPVELTALSSIVTLSLEYNQLSEQIPANIISWKLLNYLNLAHNNLSGTLPATLSLPRLHYLFLSNNCLAGQIPPELARIPEIDLSSNCFSGQVPDAFHITKYTYDFEDNAYLCSTFKIEGLHQCPSSLHYSLAAIIVPGAIIFLAFMYFISRGVNKSRQEAHSSEQHTWELKSFHKLNFIETKIVSSLTENNMISTGGSGKVYRIMVNDSGDKVAVKRIFNSRKLGEALEKQFLREIEILGTFRHPNIVKLLCCVSSAQVKLLVYEYMENQSLDRWLGRKKRAEILSMGSPDPNTIIDWPIRLRIAIGAAKGLCYLHHDCSPPIIHRDVKSSNILLDSEFNAKMADFGLAKMKIMTGDPQTASAIAGSFGYIAPEYWRTKRLNEKIDIYSFGVVLLELATGKDPCNGNNDLNLADWSWQHCCKEQPIFDALDEDIRGPKFMEQMVNVFKLGVMCTSEMPNSRPSMKQVLQLLISFSKHETSDQTQTFNEEQRLLQF